MNFVSTCIQVLVFFFLASRPVTCDPDSHHQSYAFEAEKLRTAQPLQYDLFLDLTSQEAIDGRVDIRFKFLRGDDRNFALHCDGILIENVTVVPKKIYRGLRVVSSWEMNVPEAHFMNIYVDEYMARNEEYIHKIKFKTPYSESVRGMRRSPLDNIHNGSGILASYFLPTYARRLFPCVDLPEYKALFNVTIKIPESFKIIADPDVYFFSTNRDNAFEFRTKHNISTYQLNFLVYNIRNAKLRKSITRERSLNLKTQKFENFDMVHGREIFWTTKLSPSIRSPNSLTAMRVSNKSSYHMPHVIGQEFQDTNLYYTWEFLTVKNLIRHPALVNSTKEREPHSLDLFWLSKGIENFCSYLLAGRHYSNEEEMLNLFVVTEQRRALSLDNNPLPIRIQDNYQATPVIDIMFEDNAMSKISAHMRTLYILFGKEEFDRCLNDYFTMKSSLTLKPSHFYKSLVDSKIDLNLPNERTIDDVVNSWMSQGKQRLEVFVRRYNRREELIIYYESSEDKEVDNLWLPITIKTSKSLEDNKKIITWLSPEYQYHELTIDKDDKWFILNPGNLAYFRVWYDIQSLKDLVQCLRSNRSSIPTLSRAQLIDDAFHFYKKGKIDTETMIDLSSTWINETDLYPWITFSENLEYLEKFFVEHKYDKFLQYKRKLFAPFLRENIDKYGFEVKDGDSQLDRVIRMFVLKTACASKVYECTDKLKKMFKQSLFSSDFYLHPDIQFLVSCVGMKTADEKLFEKALLNLKNTHSPATRRVLLESFACAKDKYVLHRIFEIIKHKNNELTTEDRTVMLERMIRSEDDVLENVFKFLESNTSNIYELVSTDGFRSISTALSKRVVSEDHMRKYYDLLEKWIKDKFLAPVLDHSTIERANATVEFAKKWKTEHHNNIEAILKATSNRELNHIAKHLQTFLEYSQFRNCSNYTRQNVLFYAILVKDYLK